jgi:hypothetical protein
VKPETEPRAVASIVIGTLEGALMMSRLDEDPYALEIARDHLISWLEGLRVKKHMSPKDASTPQIKAKRLHVTPE